MNKLNKRGILFTITTFLLLWSLLVLNASYVRRTDELKGLVVTTSSGDRAKYIEDDVLGELYEGMFGLEFSGVYRESGNITFSFHGFSLSSSTNHESMMQDYENYIEGSYSTLNNIGVELTNFTPTLLIEPVGNRISFNSTILKSTTTQPDNFSSLSVIVIVDRDRLDVLSNSTPSNSGSKTIYVKILDEDEDVLIDKSASLDESNSNSPFIVRFNDGSNISIRYGDYYGLDSSFTISAENLVANITSFDIVFAAPNQKLSVSTGYIKINQSDGILDKSSKATVFVE